MNPEWQADSHAHNGLPSFSNRAAQARVELYARGDLPPLRSLFESTENLGGTHWASLLVLERNFDEALESLDAAIDEPPSMVNLSGDYLLNSRSRAEWTSSPARSEKLGLGLWQKGISSDE